MSQYRYETPAIMASPYLLQSILDRIALYNPESPEFIDAFIRKLRREFRAPKKWWQRWLIPR